MSSSSSWLFSFLWPLSAQSTSVQMCSAPDWTYFSNWAWVERRVWFLLRVCIHVFISPYRLPLFFSSFIKSRSPYDLLKTISYLPSASDFKSSVEVADYSHQTEGLCPCPHWKAPVLFLLAVTKYIFILIVSSESGYLLLSTLSCL